MTLKMVLQGLNDLEVTLLLLALFEVGCIRRGTFLGCLANIIRRAPGLGAPRSSHKTLSLTTQALGPPYNWVSSPSLGLRSVEPCLFLSHKLFTLMVGSAPSPRAKDHIACQCLLM